MARTAKQISDEFYSLTQSIQADARLSHQGKQGKLARAYLKAKDEYAEATAAAAKSVTDRRTSLEQQIFGLPYMAGSGDVIAHRDAQDRAAAIETPDQAARVLALAQRSGDTVLAKAVAARAYDSTADAFQGQRWQQVLGQYAEQQPALASYVNEVVTLQNQPTGFMQMMQDGVISRPKELPNDDRQVAALADQLGAE